MPARWAVIFWALLLAAVAGRVAFSNPGFQSVVPIYLAAGQKWADREDLYARVYSLDLYRNPPVVAVGFSALADLPVKVVGLAWRGLGAGLFLLGAWRIRREFLPDLSPARAAVFFVLAGVLVLPALNNGQTNLLLVAAALNGTAAAARGRWTEAAAWLGLAGWLKVYPLALGALVAVVAPWKLIPRLAAVALAGIALPFAVADPEYVLSQYQSFLTYLSSDDRTLSELKRIPRDWSVIARTWFGTVVEARVVQSVSLAVLVGVGTLVAWAAVRGAGRRKVLGLSLGLGTVWMTAFGPATESNTYSLLAVVAAGAVVVPRAPVVAALTWSGVVLLAATVFRGMFPADWRFQVLGPQPLGALLLIPAILSDLVARPATDARPPVFVVVGRIASRIRDRVGVSRPVAARQ
ncbi:hypothetical protein FRUB_01716 [Fimbriiglobus ruber]|uniref:DUF2029 domain-containing protein n=1 Tax=Fimbriiglobus ruber TaxID=1908690 RepID=A0A225E9Z0_9BACT|nr:hypothetical protein FRUB_01716 [Fimbriiglobus ruber]